MLQLFAPITKINEATREVDVCITSEVLDKSKEIFDYESSKPHVQAWSDEIYKATSGVEGISPSRGNVRSQHGKNVAGKLTALTFDDAAKSIGGTIKVLDDNDWHKLTEGGYTGVSIGGDYVKKWDDPTIKGAKRYTAKLSEVSLVDSPCNPGARFLAVRKDGTEEFRKFTSVKAPAQFWGCDVVEHRHVAKADALACEGEPVEKMAQMPECACCANDGDDAECGCPTKDTAADTCGCGADCMDCKTQQCAGMAGMSGKVVADGEIEKFQPAFSVFKTLVEEVESLKKSIESLRVPSGNGSRSTTEEHMEPAKVETPPAPIVPIVPELAKADPLAKALDGVTAALEEIKKDNAKRDEAIETLIKYVGNLPGPARGALRLVKKEEDVDAEGKPVAKAITDPMELMKIEMASGAKPR